MKRKFLSFIFIVLFAFSANAQIDALSKSDYQTKGDLNATRITTGLKTGLRSGKVNYLNETFDTEIPSDWTITNNGDGNAWEWGNGMAWIDSDGQGQGTHVAGELCSPEVDVTGASLLYLGFDSRYNDVSLADSCSVDVWDGSEWQNIVVYTEDHGSGSGTDVVLEHFQYDITAYANANLKVRFVYDDANTFAWYQYIDNVSIYEPINNDLGVNAVSPAGLVKSGSTVTPTVIIENFGALTQDTYDITLVSDPAGYNETITNPGEVAAGNTLSVNFPDWAPADGTYTLTATVVLAGDANTGNDIATTEIEVRGFEYGDVISVFNATSTGQAGIETDGEYIYTAAWDGANIYKYDMNGNFIESFTIAGVQNVRDMAYNPNTGYFYGGAASTDLFEMDFDNKTLVSTITAPTENRAILYDDDDDTFWANNWDSPITEYDITGTATGNSIDISPTNIYGLAYDNVSNINPTVWMITNGESPERIAEYNMDGTATGRQLELSAVPGYIDGIGGGLASFTVDGEQYLLANIQQGANIIATFYLGSTVPAYTLTFNVTDGTNPLENVNITINNQNLTSDASGMATIDLEDGDYDWTATLANYNDASGTVTINGADQTVDIIMEPLGIGDLKTNVMISPNPTNGKFTVNVNGTYNLQVVDITGKVVEQMQMNNTATIDLSARNAGIYFVIISNGSASETFKVVKQ